SILDRQLSLAAEVIAFCTLKSGEKSGLLVHPLGAGHRSICQRTNRHRPICSSLVCTRIVIAASKPAQGPVGCKNGCQAGPLLDDGRVSWIAESNQSPGIGIKLVQIDHDWLGRGW